MVAGASINSALKMINYHLLFIFYTGDLYPYVLKERLDVEHNKDHPIWLNDERERVEEIAMKKLKLDTDFKRLKYASTKLFLGNPDQPNEYFYKRNEIW